MLKPYAYLLLFFYPGCASFYSGSREQTKSNNSSIISPKTAKHHDPYALQCPSLYLPLINCSSRALISARVAHRVAYRYEAFR